MLVALMKPEYIQQLIVIDNSPAAAPLDKSFYKQLVGLCHIEQDPKLKLTVSMSHLFKEADKILKKYEPNPMIRTFLLGNLRIEKKKSLLRPPVLNFLKENFLEEIGGWPGELVEGKTFDKPTLILRALQSEFITDETLENDFPKYFTNFKNVDFNTGHWLVSDDPDYFLETVVAFIEKHRPKEPIPEQTSPEVTPGGAIDPTIYETP
ncbi:hypothetical protein CANTEDRAFT_100552 [Yamadazyma tenuis ATCC 10573]|nr:uncharacterized protein CANTEDRAFT_100552 [Yamadazyma tenuis ATCC 10573]EGV66403.1 hypothetical protein CANTEDRAFT_100552 [Yamadazyma tenuis ATCC 10573]